MASYASTPSPPHGIGEPLGGRRRRSAGSTSRGASRRVPLPPTQPLSTCSFRTLPITRSLCAHLVCEFIKHIVFMREQIPCTYKELCRVVEEESAARQAQEDERAAVAAGMPPLRKKGLKRKRLRSGFRKKAVKTMDQLQDLFKGVGKAFHELTPSLAVIAIGSSISTAREKFVLHFAYTSGDVGGGGVGGGPLTEQHLASATRVLIRGIFQNSSDLFHHSVRTSKVFVAVRAPEVDLSKSQFLPDHRLLPLKRKKNRQSLPSYVIRVRGFNSEVRDASENMVSKEQDLKNVLVCSQIPLPGDLQPVDGEVWYRWPKGVKGLGKPSTPI